MVACPHPSIVFKIYGFDIEKDKQAIEAIYGKLA